jgi:hypothetical protein
MLWQAFGRWGGIAGPVASAGPTPEFRSSGAVGGVFDGTSFTVPYPAGLQANDILFLNLGIKDDLGNADVSSLSDAGFALVGSSFASDAFGKLYWKRASGSESGSVTVNLTEEVSSAIGAGVMSAWSGCIASGTPYEDYTNNTQTATTSITGAAIDTTGANRRAVSFFGHVLVATSGTNTNGWDENYDSSTATGDDATFACCSITAPSAGTVAACTRTNADSSLNNCHTLALIPA